MLVFKGADGEERSELIHHFDASGVIREFITWTNPLQALQDAALIMP